MIFFLLTEHKSVACLPDILGHIKLVNIQIMETVEIKPIDNKLSFGEYSIFQFITIN